MLELLLYLSCGVATGFMAGLLGIGGGSVIVPTLVVLLPLAGVPSANVMHLAVGTSMSIIVFTSISSVWAHQQRGGVMWDLLKTMIPGIVAGTIFGALIAGFLPGTVLKMAFGVFVIYVALRMLLGHNNKEERRLPGKKFIAFASTIMGIICSLLGIGGGAVVVPFLNRYSLPMRNVVATSAFCGFPIALAGTISYIIIGWHKTVGINDTLGYIYLPAFAGITIGSVLCAPLGAKLAHRLPTSALRRVFALFLLLVGGDMLL